MREYIRIVESQHLPRKFWLNPKTRTLFPCGDHTSAVLSDWQEMGLSQNDIKKMERHLEQYKNDDDDEDYEDAVDQNQGTLLDLALNAGWVRGGDDFLFHPDIKLLRMAARIMYYDYNVTDMSIQLNGEEGWNLYGEDFINFIRR
jgi:hypothetical protein